MRAVLTLLLLGASFAQTAQYRHHGKIPVNDLIATPGATANISVKQLCSKAFHTGSERDVTESTKKAVCEEYGLKPSQCTGAKLEIDHLISLEIGGSNDITNLWPQPYLPKPGAKEKDILENTLHRLVCAGKMKLLDAQQCISSDWIECSQRVSALK
jgi:hypothetical protein